MELGDHLGFAGIVVGLVGIGLTILFSTKRWIGYLCFAVAGVLLFVWGAAWVAQRKKPEGENPPHVKSPTAKAPPEPTHEQSPARATPKQQSRLEITKTEKVELLNKDTGAKSYGVNVYYADTGQVPITAMRRQMVVVFNPTDLTPEQEKQAEQDSLKMGPIQPSDQKNGMQPGREPPLHFFSYPDSDEHMSAFLPFAQDVLDGKMRMYFFITFKYSDESLPPHQARVTQVCGWFSQDFGTSHNCGVNRIYTVSER